jgi:hypothetical protein
MTDLPVPAPAVAWSWSSVLRGAVLGAPAAVVALHDVQAAAALSVGLMPLAPLPLAATRRARLRSGAFGVMAALALVVGGVLAVWPPAAVVGILALAVGTARVAETRPAAMVVLVAGLPLVGVGFSYPGLAPVGGLALVILAGSAYAVAVSLAWPPRAATPRAMAPAAPPAHLLRFGWLLGGAGALCAAVGFALDWEHVGWATAAALLVMRPRGPEQRLRSVDRLVDVLVGAGAAIALVVVGPPDWVYALAIGLTAVLATATGGSRWYVVPTFTTFYVFLMLVATDPSDAPSRFWERVGETAFGVGVAAALGLAVPALLDRRARARDA